MSTRTASISPGFEGRAEETKENESREKGGDLRHQLRPPVPREKERRLRLSQRESRFFFVLNVARSYT